MMMQDLNEAVENCEILIAQSVSPDIEAEQSSSILISAQPSWTQACQTVGNILTSMGFIEEAYPWHSMALDIAPNTARFYAESGRIYNQCEEWDKAIHFCQRAP